MRWWVTLGDFESDEGRIVELDEHSPCPREVSRYVPSRERSTHGKGLTGATLADDGLLVCSFNAVHHVDAGGALRDVIVRPDFNDLHHVVSAGDRIWVSNTGLDRVDVFDANGTFVGAHGLVPSDEEHQRRFDALTTGPYYSQSPDLPFHRRRVRDVVHPNHVALVGGRAIVTEFETRRLRRLDDFRVVVEETPGYPHDGQSFDDALWISCTNGLTVAYRVSGQLPWREVERLDVFSATGRTGWCRGLWVGTSVIVVGLTRITRAPRVKWCDRPFEGTETSVVVLDRATGALVTRWDLSRFGGHPKIFSIVTAPEDLSC